MECQLQLLAASSFNFSSSVLTLTSIRIRLTNALLRFESSDDVPASISADGLFSVTHTLDESTRYWFVLTDEEEFQSRPLALEQFE